MTNQVNFRVIKEARGYSVYKISETVIIYSCKDFEDMTEVLQDVVWEQMEKVVEHFKNYEDSSDSN